MQVMKRDGIALAYEDLNQGRHRLSSCMDGVAIILFLPSKQSSSADPTVSSWSIFVAMATAMRRIKTIRWPLWRMKVMQMCIN